MLRRTKRNYFGTKNPEKHLDQILPQALKKLSRNQSVPQEAVFALWFTVIGEKMGPFTEPISFQNEVLTVKVKSSTLYSLLTLHEKGRLLAKLREQFSVRDLKFRVG